MSKLEKFLNESSLSDEAKKLIQEAWNEEKSVVAAEMREEMKTRYQEDLAKLTEGLDQMMTQVITQEMKEVYDVKARLVEDRVAIRKSIGEFSKFANTVLAEEVKQMRTERKHVNESISKFINFSNNVLAEELKEFHVEKRQLVETRVKLLAEGSKQINEAKANLVKRISESASVFIADATRQNLTELKSDLLEAKQNMFGRKIFEAFANEFKTNQYNENSILRSLNESIKEKNSELLETKIKLSESTAEVANTKRKIAMMEDSQVRTAIVSELVKPLTAQQKQIMESLLVSTPTDKLKEDFNKYHKSVLKGTVTESAVSKSRPAVSTKATTTLTEGKVFTGNRPAMVENEMDSDDLAFLSELERNAGIIKK